MNVVLLGPPGAGKGTQATRLAGRRGWAHLASGDILRAEVKAGSELGRKAQGFMNAGALVPDDLILSMMAEHVSRPAAANGFVLDGFPRTPAQAHGLDARLTAVNKRIDCVVHMVVPEASLVRRLSGRWYCPRDNRVYHETSSPPTRAGVCDACGGPLAQRPDDRPEVITQRLKTYQELTTPLIGYYRDRNLLREVNGDAAQDAVTAAIESACGTGA